MTHESVTDYINVARITRTHGKRGEVVAVPLDDLPFCLKPGMRVCLTPPALHADRFFTVSGVNDEGVPPLVAFKGVKNLNDAEPLVGRLVLARREDVPEFMEEFELFDCVGCDMVDEKLGFIGVITELMQYPANDVWCVRTEKYGEVLVPILEHVVLSLPDGEDDVVTVDLPAGILPEA